MKYWLTVGLVAFFLLQPWPRGAMAQELPQDTDASPDDEQSTDSQLDERESPSDSAQETSSEESEETKPQNLEGESSAAAAAQTQSAEESIEEPEEKESTAEEGEPIESDAPWENVGEESEVSSAVEPAAPSVSDSGFRPSLKLGGIIETNFFFGFDNSALYNFNNVNLLRLTLDGSLNDNMRGFAQVELRNTNFTEVSSSADLGDRNKVDPVSIRLDEAYVEYIGLFVDGLDLKVGRQRFAWGTADGFHPTNPIDPYNLEIPIDFKERLGVTAIKLSAYLPHDISLTGAVIPLFTPSVFPTHLVSLPLPLDIPEGVTIGNSEDSIETPEAKAENFMYAARLAWNVFDFDMSLSYFYGRDTLPAMIAADATIASMDPPTFDISAGSHYPRLQQIGFDFAGSPFDIGFWGEVAVVFPEKVEAQFTVEGQSVDPLTGQDIPPTTIIDDKPFVRAVGGIDYTFTGGYYFNVQYIHGFFVERTSDALQDYVLGVFRKKLFQDKLEIEAMGGVEIDDSEHFGWLAGGELRYMPFDSGRIAIGGLIARGDEGTTLDLFRGLEQVYLRFRLNF